MLNVASFECELFALKEEKMIESAFKILKNWIISYLIDLQKCYENAKFLLNYVNLLYFKFKFRKNISEEKKWYPS
jgi:hypothetical protein